MPSNFDLLRQGKAIEFEPGVSGRLNPKTKKLELSTGEILDASNDPDFFPQNQNALEVSKHKEHLEKKAKGPAGEFLHQYTSKGIPGGISDWLSYLTQTGEQYANTKQAENQVSNRISEESPYISGAATGANIATDVAITRGMSALKAAPLLTLGSAGSRIVTDPENVAIETGLAAAGGKLIDKGAGWLSNAANRRGAIRALPGQQQAVREQNILGQQAVNQANAQQTQAFNALKQNVKNVNETRLKKYQDDLNVRQNQILQDQNAFEQRKLQRDAEVIRLKNKAEMDKAQRNANAAKSEADYRAAKESADLENKRLTEKFKQEQAQYESDLKKVPELQKQAQAEYSANVVKNASDIERSFPKNSKIYADELRIREFIDENISKSGLAGTREGAQARRVLNSMFPEGELISGRELSKKYKALEDSIQRSTPEVQKVLNSFKQHLGERLPAILEDSIAYGKMMPLLRKTIETDVKSIINDINFLGTGQQQSKSAISRLAQENAKRSLNTNVTAANFIEKVQSGELARELANSAATVEDFLMDINPGQLKNLKKLGTFEVVFEEAQRKHAYFVNELRKKLQEKLTKYEIKALESARNASKKLGKDVKQTYGLAEPVAPPSPPLPSAPVPAPSAPVEPPPIPPMSLPPPVAPPANPPLPGKPNLMPEPPVPGAQSFTPLAEPTLPPAMGTAERAGEFLEKNLMGGKGLINNPLAKLAGLKYLLGGAALPAEAAYVGAKTLTSPTALGEAARLSFKQGGIEAIIQWAQKYPSFNNGILNDPQERRSLTKEIEDASDIPIEQKAVLQSKVNRGKPLQDRL
jgi:hypothetical protein